MVTVGLDLHKRYITACALDDAGTVLAEHRRSSCKAYQAAMPGTMYLATLSVRLRGANEGVITARLRQVERVRSRRPGSASRWGLATIGLVDAYALRGALSRNAPLVVAVSTIILAVGILASLGPARRGLRIQPAEVLKQE